MLFILTRLDIVGEPTYYQHMFRRIGYMLAASLSFAIMGVFVRSAAETHLIWKVFFRNAIVLVIIVLSMPVAQWGILVGNRGNRLALSARGISGTLGVLGYFIGIQYLPLANASILNRLNPFFVAGFAALFLGQKLKTAQVVSLLLAFAGAVLVVGPGSGFPLLPTAAALSSALFAGLAYTIIRYIGEREDPRTIMAYFAFMSLLSTLPLIILWGAEIRLVELPYLLGIGVFAASGQGLLTLAYRGGHAATVSAFGYSNAVFAGILGFLLYAEKGSPAFYIGAAIILFSLLILYRQNSHIRKGGKRA